MIYRKIITHKNNDSLEILQRSVPSQKVILSLILQVSEYVSTLEQLKA